MKLYKSTEGYEYTEDEVLTAAKESDMSLDDYVAEFGITPSTQGEPGKKKPVAVKGAPVTGKVKSTESKQAPISSVSKKKLWTNTPQPSFGDIVTGQKFDFKTEGQSEEYKKQQKALKTKKTKSKPINVVEKPKEEFGVIKPEDLAGSEEEVEAYISATLSRYGLKPEQTGFGNYITLRSASGDKLYKSLTREGTYIPDDLPAVSVGGDVEELKASAITLNNYIKSHGDPDFINKSKQKYAPKYAQGVQFSSPKSRTFEEKLKEYNNDLVSKFKTKENLMYDKPSGETMGTAAVGYAGPRVTPVRKDVTLYEKDFDTPEEYKLYQSWKKNGIIPIPSTEKLENFIRIKNADYREKKFTEFMADLEPEERVALSAIKEGKKDFRENVVEQGAILNQKSIDLNKKIEKANKIPLNDAEKMSLMNEYTALTADIDLYKENVALVNKEAPSIEAVAKTALDDYNRFNQAITGIKSIGTDVLYAGADVITSFAAATQGMSGTSYNVRKSLLKPLLLDPIYALKSDLNKEGEMYQKDLHVAEIRSMKDAGRWGASVLTQMPASLSLAVTGEFAMPLFFLSGFGGKAYEIANAEQNALNRLERNKNLIDAGMITSPEQIAEVQKQMLQDKKILAIPESTKITSAVLSGTAEVIFEKLGTLNLIKKTKHALDLIPPAEIKASLKRFGKETVVGAPIEGITEGFTRVTNNFGDIYLLGQDKNLFDGVPDDIAGGTFMGPGFAAGGGMNNIAKAAVSEITTKAEYRQREQKLKEIQQLTGLEDITGLTVKEVNKLKLNPEVKKAVNELIVEMDGEDLKVLDRLGKDFSIADAKKIGDLNMQLRKTLREWSSVSKNSELSDSELKTLKDYYENKYNTIFTQREAYLNDEQLKANNRTKSTKQRVLFSMAEGTKIYQARLLQKTSINAISDFKKLDNASKQPYYDQAADQLRVESTDPNFTPLKSDIAKVATEIYVNENLGAKLKEDIKNAQQYSEDSGLNTNIQIFEGKDASENSLKAAEQIYGKGTAKYNEVKEQIAKGASFEGFNENGQIVIHIPNSIANGKTSVGSHEVLHSVVSNAIKSNQELANKAGLSLFEYLEKEQPDLHAVVSERMKAYDQETTSNYGEEIMNALSDSFSDGGKPSDTVLTKISKVLYKISNGKIGIPDNSIDVVSLESMDGKAIYELIKSFHNVAGRGEKGKTKARILVTTPDEEESVETIKVKFSKSIQEKMDALDEQLNNDEIDYDTYEVRMDALVKEEEKVLKANKEGKVAEEKPKEVKKETPEDEAKSVVANNKGLVASDKVQKIYDTEGVNGAQKIIDLFRPITSKIVDKRRDAPGFDKELLTDEIETGIGGILDLIQKYKPESGIPLAAYINKYLPVRAIATSRRILGETFSKDVEDQKGLMATETADQFTETAMPDKPKYKTILESNVFDQEVIKSVTDKLKIVLRTLKSKINEPISKNTTVTPLVNEIRNEMGTQADIDIKRALGGKEGGVLKNNLIKNKKAILENMTTTWLMGKDTKSGVQGGVPSAIQKQINGKWVSYPDWIGQKIDREKTTTNLAGKTSGAEIVRRLPNAANNISNEEFLSWFVEPSGNPIRGRKESLSKALGEELSFDIFKKELEEDGEIAKVFEKNQELKDVVLLDTYINEVAKQIDRGTVKFSKSTKSELEYNMKIADSQGGASLMDDIAVTQGNSEDDKRDRLIYEGAIAINDFKNTLKSPISSYKAEIKKANGEFNIQIFNNPKIPDYLKDEYLDKNREVNKNDVAEIGDKLAKILPKEFLDAVGIQIFGYHNKLLDPAFEKGGKGGPRAEFYDRSQELKEAFDSNNVPNNTGVDFSKVRIMNINAPGGKNGLFRRIIDLQESNESDVNKKIEKLVELLPEITDANTENKKAAVLFTEKIGELLLDEKINFNAVVDLLKAQTNFVMGLRALTNLSVVELRSGKQEEKKKGEHINPNVHKMTKLVGLYAEALSSLSEGGLKSDILKKLNYELNLLFTDHSQALMNLPDSKIMDNLGSPTSRDGFKRFNLIPEVKKYLYTPSGSLFNEIELTNQIENEKNAIRNLAKFSKIVSDGIQAETVRGLLNNNQLEELQKEIEANYSTKLKLGNESNDIRTSLFNYDDPIARKMSNGVDLRITEGLIRNNKKTYLLYADGKIVGQFETVNQAKDLIKYIEDNLIKPTAIEQSPVKFSLSSRRDLKWRQTDEALATNFKVGDIDYKIALIETAYMEYDEKTESILYDLADKNNLNEDILTAWEGEAYNLEFWDKKQGNGITGTGNAAEVFGIVINGVIDIANKKNIKSFIFTAKEQSRIKLYDAISSVVANKLDWNNYSKDGVYIISKEGKPNNGKVKFSKSLDKEFNIILAQNKGVSPAIKYSGITAKRQGSSKGKYKFFLPPGAEDFEGLLYNFIGKGKLGEEQAKFFEETLIDPYWNGISEIESARQRIKKDFIALKEAFPDASKKITKRIPGGDFTYDQAIRVYLWAKEGKKIPDLSKSDQTMLTRLIANDNELSAFANGLELISGRDGQWSDPSEYWDSETIVSELNDMTEKIGRKKYLEEFIKNSDEIFSKENLNKVEALYGEGIRDAIEDSLYRMTNGKNRSQGTGRFTAAVSTWLNGSVAEIMFLNTKSGVLQLISALNYLNLRDNNPVMAGKALLDFPQFSEDFAKIFNSDMMKERRQGLKEDVSAAEIANAAATAKNKVRATVAYLAKIGFTPTTIADALAIGFGGATFYRNRINTYKKQGMPETEAEAKAWKDFTRLTNKSAQSNDPALISQQQAEPIGRLILAFGNATLQMNRIMKKSARDLINGRGNPSEHVSKILFYGFIQNAIFSAMQKALFIGLFGLDDEDEDKKKKKTAEEKAFETADDMLDSFLRGSGLAGAIVSTAKNTTQQYFKQREKKQKGDQAYTLIEGLNLSPSLGSKARKIYGAIQEEKFNRAVMEKMGGQLMLEGRLNPSPAYMVGAKVTSALTNLPADRLLDKVTNISEALDARNENWQRAMLMIGYKPFEIDVKNEEQEAVKAQAKIEREDEVFIKGVEKKKAQIKRIRSMSPEERRVYVDSIRATVPAKIERAKRRRKLLYGK
jgi:hypothetical protein